MSPNSKKSAKIPTVPPSPFLISISFLMGDEIIRLHGAYPHLTVEKCGATRLRPWELKLVSGMLLRISGRLACQLEHILASTSARGTDRINIGRILNPTSSELGGDAPFLSEDESSAEFRAQIQAQLSLYSDVETNSEKTE